jgi:hypothetical protein
MKNEAHHDLIESLTREALSRFRVPAGARVRCFLIHHDKLVLLPKASPLRKRYRLYEYPALNEFKALKGTKYALLIDTGASELELSMFPQGELCYSIPFKFTRGRLVFGQPQKVFVCGSPTRK